MRQAAILIAALLLSGAAVAQPVTYGVGLTTVSQHFGGDGVPCNAYLGGKFEQYREVNPGISGRMIFGPALEIELGAYANSVHRVTVFTSSTWTPLQAGPLRAGVMLGGATGYCTPVLPFGGLVLNFDVTRRLSLQLLASPPIGDQISGVGTARVLLNF